MTLAYDNENAVGPSMPSRIPLTPSLRVSSIRLRSRRSPGTLLDARSWLLTNSARCALALALEQLGIGPGDEVLIPAYHCSALSGPVIAAGAVPVFYRLTAQLDADLESVRSLTGARTRCLIVVHFFGFPRQLDGMAEHCKQHRLLLIEDCAHAFYLPRGELRVVGQADVAIGSLMKFLPVFDGGCLVSDTRTLHVPALARKGILFELKALIHVVERALSHVAPRFSAIAFRGLSSLVRMAGSASPAVRDRIRSSSPDAVYGDLSFDPSWTHVQPSRISSTVLNFTDHDQVVARRRAIYGRYLHAFGELSGGSPLYADLPSDVVPYVFPLLLTRPEWSFDALWSAGVPMFRWEEVAVESCPVTRNYSARLVQLPCHQSLTDPEVSDLILRVRTVLGAEQPPDIGP